MQDTRQDRFFVTVAARSADDLRRLQQHGLDLFAPTARRQKGRSARPFSIEGLLDEAEIAKLRAAGYEVTVDASMTDRTAQPGEPLELDAWLDKVRELTAKDRTIK